MQTITDFLEAKQRQQPIAMLTAYDYTTARLLNQTPVDTLLVGDSLAMTVLGHPNTLQLTVEGILPFVRAVTRAAPDKWVVADMPFMSYQAEHTQAIQNAGVLIQQGGAQSVKLEGATSRTLAVVEHLTEIGIPVMGHLGLTPQSVHTLGGFRVQGKTVEAAEKLMTDALALQAAGCYAMVLECIPPDVAQAVSQALSIPTIGIGAGPGCDGQVLVIDDMLGRSQHRAKFVRVFSAVGNQTQQAATDFCAAVQNRTFPTLEQESYKPLNNTPVFNSASVATVSF